MAVAICSFCTTQISCAQDNNSRLSPIHLRAAVSKALDSSDEVKRGQLEVQIANSKYLAGRTHLFPQTKISAYGFQLLTPLRFRFNRGSLGSSPSTGPIPFENIDVETSQRPLLLINSYIAQPLLHLGKISAKIEQARLQRSMARQKVRLIRTKVANQVRQVYLKILDLEESLKVIESSEKLFAEIERTTDQYLKERLILPAQSMEVRKQIADLSYQRTKVVNAIACEKEELNDLMGDSVDKNLLLADFKEDKSEELDLSEEIDFAILHRPELQVIDLQNRQIKLEKRIKKWEYVPELNLVADYFSIFGSQIIPKNVVSVGLFLNWEPIDWGRRNIEIKLQNLNLKHNQIDRDRLINQIKREIGFCHRKLEEAKKKRVSTKLGRDIAVERLRVVNVKYKENAALLKDLLMSQKDLVAASSEDKKALLTIWAARADLDHALGK